jgi:hypothetical protein
MRRGHFEIEGVDGMIKMMFMNFVVTVMNLLPAWWSGKRIVPP